MTTIPLSPIDHLFIGAGSYPIEFAFYYPQGLPRNNLEESMQRGWNKLQRACPLMSCRLMWDKSRFVLKSADATDVPWEWVRTSQTVHPQKVADRYSLVAPVQTTIGEPLIKVKISEGLDGATLGFSVSHVIADGFTFFSLLSAWAQATQGGSLPQWNHQREILWQLPTPQEHTATIGFSESESRQDILRSDIKYSHRILTRDFLNDLLAKSDDGNVRLSHNDVACALLWQEHMATVAVDEKEVSLVNPVDFRRVLAGFPHNYAGNAVVLSRTDILRDELLAAPIGNTARLIRANLLRVNDNYIQNSVRALTSRLTKDPRHGCDTIHITNPCSGILMTNLSRLPLDGLDFGNGTPLSCMPLTPCRNTIVFTSDRCGGMEAHIQL